MSGQEDDLMFADESAHTIDEVATETWKILIVDDEEQVHTVTRFAMRDFTFLNRQLNLLSARSSHEAIEMLQ